MPIKHPQEKGGKKPTNWLQYPPLITVDGAFKAEKYLTKEKKIIYIDTWKIPRGNIVSDTGKK